MNDVSSQRLGLAALLLILACGALLRIVPTMKITAMGFDEAIYNRYVTVLSRAGLSYYPELCRGYVAAQGETDQVFLPPTRVTYLTSAWAWLKCFGGTTQRALRNISCLATILTLCLAAAWTLRAAGLGAALAVTALMSCAPMQIAMSQRMFIDGVLTFWSVLALWTLWECLRQPEHKGWLATYTVSLAGMVLTKENSAFIYLGLLAILALNRWLKIGRISLKLIVCTLVGPAIGVGLLILVCGSITTFIQTYQLNVQKSVVSPYAIKTGDGPWYRYLIDLVIMSPVVTIFALAAMLRPEKENKVMLYLLVFVFASYALMGKVRYGMNLRYANIWDLPMRWLTWTQLVFLATNYSKKRLQPFVLGAAVAVICMLELRQYLMFFAEADVYDPVTEPLLRVLKILK